MKNLFRMVLAIGLCAGAICGGEGTGATDLALEPKMSLQRALTQLAEEARPGTLGVTVTDLQTGRTWRVNSERAYPMMSVFKAPLGATVLSNVDKGLLSLDQSVLVRRAELAISGSKIASTFHGYTEAFTIRQLLEAAVSHSDNTAADVLLKVVGGPGGVTAFLRNHGIQNMRVDRGEDELAQEFLGQSTVSTVGAKEAPAQTDARLRRGYAAYLQDPRDRTTPDAAATFLKKLWQRQLLSPGSTQLLLTLLYNQTIPNRLRSGLPPKVRLADKCGTSYTLDGMTAAFNDIGIMTWPNGHTVIVAAFLTASRASEGQMTEIFKATAQAVAGDIHP